MVEEKLEPWRLEPRPEKTITKQMTGIFATSGMLALCVVVAGAIMAIIGASWSARDEWDLAADLNITAVASMGRCTYTCNCVRTCALLGDDPETCDSTKRCGTCEGALYEYHGASETLCPNCPHPIRMVRGCEANDARWGVGDVLTETVYVRRDCNEFALPEDFELGYPVDWRHQAEPQYVWRAGVIALCLGAIGVVATVGLWHYAGPSYRRAEHDIYEYSLGEWGELMRYNLGEGADIPPMPQWFARNPFLEKSHAAVQE